MFVRAIQGIGAGGIKLSVAQQAEVWGPGRLEGIWSRARDAIGEVLARLGEHGILTGEVLPSTAGLIPLFVLHDRFAARGYPFRRALRWLLLATRAGRYSGAALTRLHEDVRAIAQAASFEEAMEALERHLGEVESLTPEDFLLRHGRSESRYQQLMLYLVLFRRGARDWHQGNRLAYDRVSGQLAPGFEPQWHHLYPRALLRKHGVDQNLIDALANLTCMNASTNAQRLVDYSPAVSIQRLGVSPDVLRQHLIPDPWASDPSEATWSVTRYEEFLRARAELIARACRELLEELGRS